MTQLDVAVELDRRDAAAGAAVRWHFLGAAERRRHQVADDHALRLRCLGRLRGLLRRWRQLRCARHGRHGRRVGRRRGRHLHPGHGGRIRRGGRAGGRRAASRACSRCYRRRGRTLRRRGRRLGQVGERASRSPGRGGAFGEMASPADAMIGAAGPAAEPGETGPLTGAIPMAARHPSVAGSGVGDAAVELRDEGLP